MTNKINNRFKQVWTTIVHIIHYIASIPYRIKYFIMAVENLTANRKFRQMCKNLYQRNADKCRVNPYNVADITNWIISNSVVIKNKTPDGNKIRLCALDMIDFCKHFSDFVKCDMGFVFGCQGMYAYLNLDNNENQIVIFINTGYDESYAKDFMNFFGVEHPDYNDWEKALLEDKEHFDTFDKIDLFVLFHEIGHIKNEDANIVIGVPDCKGINEQLNLVELIDRERAADKNVPDFIKKIPGLGADFIYHSASATEQCLKDVLGFEVPENFKEYITYYTWTEFRLRGLA